MSRNAEEFNRRPSVPDTHFVDNRIYGDPDVFREEQEKTLGKEWKFVAHESEIAAPNDYRITSVAGTPLVVARGHDGSSSLFAAGRYLNRVTAGGETPLLAAREVVLQTRRFPTGSQIPL